MTANRTSADTGLSPAVRAVADAVTPREFLDQLNALREWHGLSYTQIGTKAGKGMSRSTAQAMLTKDELPPQRHLHLFLRSACKVSAEEYGLWVAAWERIDGADDVTEVTAFRPPLTAPVAPPEAPPEPPVAPAAEPARPVLPYGFRVLVAICVLVSVISGSAITMWLLGLPLELITTVYCLVVICVIAWTIVARYHHPPTRVESQPDVMGESLIGDVPRVAQPVIGLVRRT